jgi:hypothetical protein
MGAFRAERILPNCQRPFVKGSCLRVLTLAVVECRQAVETDAYEDNGRIKLRRSHWRTALVAW